MPGTVPNAHTVTHPALTTDGRIRTRRWKHREITARQLQRDQARAARLPEGRDPKHCAPASWGKQDRRDASRLSSRHCDVSSRKRRPGSLEGDADFRKGGQQSEALRRERRWPVTWRRQEGGYGELRKRTFEVGTAVVRQKGTCWDRGEQLSLARQSGEAEWQACLWRRAGARVWRVQQAV